MLPSVAYYQYTRKGDQTMKKYIALLISILLAFGCMPGPVFAETEEAIDFQALLQEVEDACAKVDEAQAAFDEAKEAVTVAKADFDQKKKAQSLARTKLLTISKVKGTLTYKKVMVGTKTVNKKVGKKFVINAKTGKLTVKKGVKKGTYKVKVKVTDSGTRNYNKVTRTVVFTVKVK